MSICGCIMNDISSRVERASEFALSEAFPTKKRPSGNSQAVALQSCDQLRDHDDAYSEAEALLSDWLGSKLQLDQEIEEDDLTCPTERESPPAQTANYSNFDELYNHLAEEDEHYTVNSLLQDLMEREVLDSEKMEELVLDVGQTRKKFRDPILTMEARHQQVRENRARRDAERQEWLRQEEAQLEAKVDARRKVQEEEMRKKKEARREEELVQQEMVRLRCQMGERKAKQQLPRQRERLEEQRAAKSLQSAPPYSIQQQQQETEKLRREQKVQIMAHMNNLKCLQRHFSTWYSVVLDRRLRVGKAKALYDWKMQLRAWRAWRAVLWAEKKKCEVVRTEEALRAENRQCHLAVESDRRRLLRRCLHNWQLWCRTERSKRELLAQQQETRCKMAALINAASTGKLKATRPPDHQSAVLVTSCQPNPTQEPTGKEDPHKSVQLTEPWQVSRRHVAPTAAELHKARQRIDGGGFVGSRGGRFENKHAAQQQIITQQRKRLKEQQEEITRLKEKQDIRGLKMEAQKKEALIQPKSCNSAQTRTPGGNGDPVSRFAPPRKAVTHQTLSHPLITAMEERALQRAERRREIEEIRRKKDEEKLAAMKAAEEQMQREEEEEKRRAAEKRREEKQLKKMREEERLRQLEKHREQLKRAHQHYHRTLLLRRGLLPWKRLIQLKRDNTQLAETHNNLFLLRRFTLAWQQSARESLSKKEASADQLHQHFLLWKSLSGWKRQRERRMIQEERAQHFYRTRTLRMFLLALLSHVTQKRLVELDCLELAQEHNNRRLLQRCLLAWSQLPYLQRKERESAARREKLGRKVMKVLPDFYSHPQ
ncbi:coiled-coil domain-containing protein 191 [Aulostomus maculatus]